jgi:HEAT repeat protein
MGSIGLFLDLAGKDMHDTRERAGTAWTQETYGAGIDLPDEPKAKDAPKGRPKLSREKAEKRVDKEAGDDLEKLWALASKWTVGEMADVIPVARDRLFAMGEPALRKARSRVGTRSGLELRAVQDQLKRFGEKSLPPLVAMLKDKDPRRRSQAAGLLADLGATETAKQILPLLDESKTKSGALDALARLGDASVWPEVAKLLEDESERARVAAIRCLQKLKAIEAAPALRKRLTAMDMFTVRFAAEDALVSFGRAEGLLELARSASDLTQRRHAIRALGRMGSPGAQELIQELVQTPDWRVRFDAVGALAAYLEDPSARVHLELRGEQEKNPYVRSRLQKILED